MFFGRVAPHRTERHTFEVPALVLGHRRDPVHPFGDAGVLGERMPNARRWEADSLIELRVHPGRLTDEIAGFLDEVWGKPAAAVKRPANARAKRPVKRARQSS